MSRALLTSSAPVQRFAVMECTPCRVGRLLRSATATATAAQPRQQLQSQPLPSPVLCEGAWSLATAGYAVDAAVGSVLLGGASEVLVPVSLVHYVNSTLKQTGELPSFAMGWTTLREEDRLVVLVADNQVAQFLASYPLYDRLCVPAPAGPLAAKMFFHQTERSFYESTLQHVCGAVESANADGRRRVQWRAWLRSGLSCKYEGSNVAPIRVAENVAALLKDEGGCSQVVLEQGVDGLSPRWLETIVKTALACGVPTAALSFALAATPNAPRLMSKAVEVGVSQFTTTTLSTPSMGSGDGLFDGAQPLVGLDMASAFAIGWGEAHGGGQLSHAEEQLLATSAEYAQALTDEWEALAEDLAAP